jgi:WD40 repeat protein
MKSQITKKVPLIAALIIIVISLFIAHFVGDLKLINNAVAVPIYQACTENIKSVENITAAFSPDGNLLATVESSGAITVRDVASGQVVWEQVDESNPKVTGLAFAQNGKLLASLGIGQCWFQSVPDGV